MHYTPGQLRDATGLTPETFRHWKKALPPLRALRGHGPCFTSGDLVAVAIVRTLTDELGLRVSAISSVAAELFRTCNAAPWAGLERAKIVLRANGNRLLLMPELDAQPLGDAHIVVPLRPIIAALRDHLAPMPVSGEQPMLRFPPHDVSASASRL